MVQAKNSFLISGLLAVVLALLDWAHHPQKQFGGGVDDELGQYWREDLAVGTSAFEVCHVLLVKVQIPNGQVQTVGLAFEIWRLHFVGGEGRNRT